MKLIAGSGRSGTTWVLDSLAKTNGLRPVFEPLHPHVSEVGNRYAHRALRASDSCPDLEQFFAEVVAGRALPLWTRYRRQIRWLLPPPAEFSTWQDAGRTVRRWGKLFRDLPELFIAARRKHPLVKCIRANLMLDWLVRSQGCLVVLIVRHPAAVIESELRASWNSDFALDRFSKNKTLHELTSGRYLPLLGRKLSAVEGLAARWVIENQWVVEQSAQIGVSVVHYEQLRSSPDSTWPIVIQALGIERAPSPALLDVPSQQSSPRSANAEPLSRRTRWLRTLSTAQLAEIQGVLDCVECDMYSIAGPEPRATSRAVARAAAGAPV
jgi:hypothetical protein